MARVSVVGAGAVGLSCALNIQDQIPGAQVTIIADKFGDDTTSAGAGGGFRPSLKHIQGSSIEDVKQWCRDSWRHFSGLAQSSLSSKAGIYLVSGFHFSNVPQPPFYKDIVFHFRVLTPEEMKSLNVPHKYGFAATSVNIEVKKYLRWMMNKFLDQGGQVESRKINSLGELVCKCDVVVNCCGLAARDLVGDKSVYPVRGQLLTIKAPWVKHWMYTEEDTYFFLHSETITVGGCRQKDNYSTEVDPAMSEDILRRAKKLYPALEGGEVVGEWVGLRPTRNPVRVEKEIMNFGGRELRVVHNYGHGANGVTLSEGTAQLATRLVKQFVRDIHPVSKL